MHTIGITDLITHPVNACFGTVCMHIIYRVMIWPNAAAFPLCRFGFPIKLWWKCSWHKAVKLSRDAVISDLFRCSLAQGLMGIHKVICVMTFTFSPPWHMQPYLSLRVIMAYYIREQPPEPLYVNVCCQMVSVVSCSLVAPLLAGTRAVLSTQGIFSQRNTL